jgi:hypothetical protein
MTVDHQFVHRPHGPAWCFCQQADCHGWQTYAGEFRENVGADPTDEDIELDRALIGARDTLVGRYEAVFECEIGFETALELYRWESTADQAVGGAS